MNFNLFILWKFTIYSWLDENLCNGKENHKDKAEDNQGQPKDGKVVGLTVLQIWEKLKIRLTKKQLQKNKL